MGKICLGGSFNPIHIGHLICARAAAETIGSESVVLIPNAVSPLKQNDAEIASGSDRVAMCRLAVQSTPNLTVDDREIRRSGPSYTIDTVRELKADGWNEVNWLIGADMLNVLPKWHKPDFLIREANLIVMARPGFEFDWDSLPSEFRVLQKNVVAVPQIQISASEIRARVAKGFPIDFLTPPAVCQYIRDRRLYLPESVGPV
jgi:nicotinate-nucleotide adenylyltransferase